MRVLLFAATAVVGAGIGVAAAVRSTHGSSAPAASASYAGWAAGARPAPSFSLRVQSGRALTTASACRRR